MTTDIKICGLKTQAALDAALGDCDAHEARYVGLVFFPKSPRNVDIDLARRLAERARGKAKVVALLVDPDDTLVDQVTAGVAPDFLQLHGRETVERIKQIRQRTSASIIKAVGVTTSEDVSKAVDYDAPGAIADIVLFDAKPPAGGELPGGNGLPFDWRVLANAADIAGRKYMLSGGLTPDNVAAAIELTKAAMVDVSSGVEFGPGQKDPELIARFIRAVKTAKQAD